MRNPKKSGLKTSPEAGRPPLQGLSSGISLPYALSHVDFLCELRVSVVNWFYLLLAAPRFSSAGKLHSCTPRLLPPTGAQCRPLPGR